MARRARAQKSSPTKKLPVLPILGGVLGVGFLVLFGYAIWASFQPEPQLGEAVPIAGQEHIPLGQKAVDWNTDPPTSGQHYDQPAEGGFYEVAPPDEQLVHNLEHGYIILYYNCAGLNDTACTALHEDIQQSMSQAGVSRNTRTPKLIAAPRQTMENRITLTSWGRIYRVDSFDSTEYALFVEQYRDQAPEPFAP
jgi:hypothetical protein